MQQAKSRVTDLVRQAILATVHDIRETERAEASLIDLSFQSTLYLERHVWIGVYGKMAAVEPEESTKWDATRCISIDLEDWDNSEQWDNTVEHHQTVSIEEAVQIVARWLNMLDRDNPIV